MEQSKRLLVGLIAAVSLTVTGAGEARSSVGRLMSAKPNKDLSPTDVIKIQLSALAHNGLLGEDRGIEVTWRFASRANREVTGPLPRFRAMVKSGYSEMLDHRRSKLANLDLTAVQAKQVVFLEARDGQVHAYLWVLGLQETGPHRGCWMTDAVFELEARTEDEAGPDEQRDVI